MDKKQDLPFMSGEELVNEIMKDFDAHNFTVGIFKDDEFTSFMGRDDVVVIRDTNKDMQKQCLVYARVRINSDGIKYEVYVNSGILAIARKYPSWREMLEANLSHEKSHIEHGDLLRNMLSDEEAINLHKRAVPALSEARADRYACKCGYGKALLKFLRILYWGGNCFSKNDIGARIELIKRYLKKHH